MQYNNSSSYAKESVSLVHALCYTVTVFKTFIFVTDSYCREGPDYTSDGYSSSSSPMSDYQLSAASVHVCFRICQNVREL